MNISNLIEKSKSVTDFGALGDGKVDCYSAFQNALKEEQIIYIPKGRYIIEKTLKIPSNRTVIADNWAVIIAKDGCFEDEANPFLITNSDDERGNYNISIYGGTWNRNNIANSRKDWRMGPNTGVTFGFAKVKGLTLENINFANSETYNIRLSFVEDFFIENIRFFNTEHTPSCQDGVHIGGGCKNGSIKNIYAAPGATGDDLIALNADDVNYTCMNRGMIDAPISDITIENVRAEDCFSAVRLLSIKNPISNVKIKNIVAGIREFAINCDASRYCADPLFSDADYPDGVGCLENILFEDVTFWKNSDRELPLIGIETNCRNFVIKNFKVVKSNRDISPVFRFSHLKPTVIVKDEQQIELKLNETALKDWYEFDCLSFN